MRITRSVQVLLLALVVLVSATSFAGVFVSVRIGPPALPVYTQPICPGPGYAWTPGYWAWGPDGYYWVPGTWVVAPVGLLWTPGYWAFGDGAYLWHEGYWGPTVGFYGGINYGFGYTGVGFGGGYWRGRNFYYNRAVTNVNVTVVRNVYTKTVVRNVTVNRVSFNGGNGGINARPTVAEERAARERHEPAVAMQQEHERAAAKDRVLLASANHGRPEIAATAKPGEFRGHGAVAASRAGAPYNPEGKREATPQPNGKAERNVPRPPATDRSNASNSDRKGSVSEARNHTVPRPASAHPDNTPRRENSARPEKSTHREDVPKPENAARRNEPRNEPRNSAPRPENNARQEKPSHPDRAPQQQKAPRPEKDKHPGGEDRPH
jgi:hypothetical protein